MKKITLASLIIMSVLILVSYAGPKPAPQATLVPSCTECPVGTEVQFTGINYDPKLRVDIWLMDGGFPEGETSSTFQVGYPTASGEISVSYVFSIPGTYQLMAVQTRGNTTYLRALANFVVVP